MSFYLNIELSTIFLRDTFVSGLAFGYLWVTSKLPYPYLRGICDVSLG